MKMIYKCFVCFAVYGGPGPTDVLEKQFPDVYCVRRIQIVPISEISFQYLRGG